MYNMMGPAWKGTRARLTSYCLEEYTYITKDGRVIPHAGRPSDHPAWVGWIPLEGTGWASAAPHLHLADLGPTH